nr:hypothetical protein [Haemoproteus columbae]
MKILFLFNKKLYFYLFKNIYGLNLYKINLLFMIQNIFLFNNINIHKIKISLYRLKIYIFKILKIKSNNIILNKIKKFNLK